METRSGRRRSPPPPPPPHVAHRRRSPQDADLISDLPDDVLLLVLVRLRCVRAAARTGLLSRRWRGLWTCLPDLTFRGVPPATVESALASFAASPTLPLLDICIRVGHTAAQASSLLRAAAVLSPAELFFDFPGSSKVVLSQMDRIELPCFDRTILIKLETWFCVMPPPAGEFTALERLSLKACILNLGTFTPQSAGEFPALKTLALDGDIVDLGTFLNRCPRLHNITRLSWQELVFTHLIDTLYDQKYRNVNLPCFPHAVSIKIKLYQICFTRLLGGKFSKLDSMILKGCIIHDLSTLVSLCPCLRVLKVKAGMSKCEITIHSTSLQEIVLYYYTECRGVDIVTPMLKQLTMDFEADKDINVFISAPMLESVSLERSYIGLPIVFDFWHLHSLSLDRQGLVRNNHVLYVSMYALNSSSVELDFAQEIEKILITDFSVLDLSLEAKGHVYGATLLRLFSVPRVHTGLKLLKVILLRLRKSEVVQSCPGNCQCDSPKNWRSQSISMVHLEEVEIKGLKGEDHDFDVLKLILRCAPSLKRMTVELETGIKSHGHGDCTKEINSISLEYPSVDFHVYLQGNQQHAFSSRS
ncbi:uncharacterized protein LOC125522134 [Triticum urartu]|uniref:uncharacterized protein LOC125522133 n=1 Tax=Triticum urartu TaxID=4572 RepID=UPI00204432C1|nr:uncharacterized protein LOC125522133 [Triticum urartu]XP_048543170.1 uncharacterized protein LOC125522134 [Triticum urartu]